MADKKILEYETDVHCPVCKKFLFKFTYSQKEFTGSIILMQAIHGHMRMHDEESPACGEHPDWNKGAYCVVHEVVPVKVGFSELKKPRGPL